LHSMKQEINSIKKIKSLLSDNKGSAMITALVVGVVISGFCLVTLLVSYTLYVQTARQNWQLQCRNLAQTFAENINAELTDTNSDLHKDIKAEVLGDAVLGTTGIAVGDTKLLEYTVEGPSDMRNYVITLKLSCTKKSENTCSIEAEIKCEYLGEGGRDSQSYSITKNIASLIL